MKICPVKSPDVSYRRTDIKDMSLFANFCESAPPKKIQTVQVEEKYGRVFYKRNETQRDRLHIYVDNEY